MLSAEEKSDPRTRRTRELLQQAFLDLARIKRFEDLTVKDIAERATVNRATFYAHFDDKYALLDESIRATFMAFVRRRLPAGALASSSDLEQLVLVVCDFLKQFDGGCWQAQRRFDTIIEREIKAALAELLHTWLAAADTQQLPEGLTAELGATIASWAIYAAALHWSRQRPRQPAEEFARAVLPLIAGNLALIEEQVQ